MGRIRTIKPEFPQSETIGKLSRDARLLFILLWTFADDSGRARASSRMLASLLYPYDEDAPELMDGWLAELHKQNCIRLYQVDGNHYLEIVNWEKHQKIERPSGSKLPPFTVPSPRARRKITEPSVTDLGPRTMDNDLGPRTITEEAEVSSVSHEQKILDFSDFWGTYPKRCGTNSRAKASEKFALIVKAGTDPATIIAGAAAYAAHCDAEQKTNTEFVQKATTWLNERGWETEYVKRNGQAAKGVSALEASRARNFAVLDAVLDEAHHRETEGGGDDGKQDPERVYDPSPRLLSPRTR